MNIRYPIYEGVYRILTFQRLNRERRRGEVNERKERRYVRQKGKSLRIRHQKKSRRTGKKTMQNRGS